MTPEQIAAGLRAHARYSIRDGDDNEWYARTERAGDDLFAAGLCRRPFLHDRRILVPNVLGISVRTAIEALAHHRSEEV